MFESIQNGDILQGDAGPLGYESAFEGVEQIGIEFVDHARDVAEHVSRADEDVVGVGSVELADAPAAAGEFNGEFAGSAGPAVGV